MSIINCQVFDYVPKTTMKIEETDNNKLWGEYITPLVYYLDKTHDLSDIVEIGSVLFDFIKKYMINSNGTITFADVDRKLEKDLKFKTLKLKAFQIEKMNGCHKKVHDIYGNPTNSKFFAIFVIRKNIDEKSNNHLLKSAGVAMKYVSNQIEEINIPKFLNFRKCNTCNRKDKNYEFKHCARCRDKYYCSKKCQISDWEEHRKICRKMPTFFVENKNPKKYDKFDAKELWENIKSVIIDLCKNKNNVGQVSGKIMIMTCMYIRKNKKIGFDHVERQIRKFNPPFYLKAVKCKKDYRKYICDAFNKPMKNAIYIVCPYKDTMTNVSKEKNLRRLKQAGIFAIPDKMDYKKIMNEAIGLNLY